MAYNKVIYDGNTLIDLTEDTITASDLLNGVTAHDKSGASITGNIASKTSSNLTVSGATVTAEAGYYASNASKSIPNGTYKSESVALTSSPGITINNSGLITASNNTTHAGVKVIDTDGYFDTNGGCKIRTIGTNTKQLDVQEATAITPTESSQTAVTAGKYTIGAITVNAIPSNYVGSDIPSRTSADLTSSGATVSVPSGYYGSEISKSVVTGTASTPATTITANPSISINASGLITATSSASKSVTPTVSAGYVSTGTAGTITVNGSNIQQLTTVNGSTITPTEETQTAVAKNVYTLGAVNVGAISSTYVGSGITRRSGTDLTASGATVTVPSGYYSSQATKSVATGSAGTPTATKGSVSNHSISITPSVTNTAGYITGSTKTGTAVTVSASELVSGNKAISSNGTGIDVVNYSTVSVNVDTGPDIPTFTITWDSSWTTNTVVCDETFSNCWSRYDSGDTGVYVATLVEGESPDQFTVATAIDGASNDFLTYTVNGSSGPLYDIVYHANSTIEITDPSAYTHELTATSNGSYYPNKGVYTYVTVNVPPSGTDTSDATLNSNGQLLNGVTAYSKGTKYTGNIPTRTASSLTVSGDTVTVPSGYYSSQVTKSVAIGSASTPATTITANPTISVNSSGLITATTNASQNITPTVSAGYVATGTSGTVTVSGSKTQQLTTKAATTYNTSSTDQTIASGTYLTGTQTIKAVKVAGLSAGNIASGVTVKVGDDNDDDRITSVTGTLSFITYYTGTSTPASSLGSDGDIYLKTS